MATLKFSKTKTVVFMLFLLVASIYRVILETRLWKATYSAANASTTYNVDDLRGIRTFLNHSTTIEQQRQLPAAGSGTAAGGSSLPPPPPRIQQPQQQQQAWNNQSSRSTPPLYIRPDDLDFLASSAYSLSSSSNSSLSSSSALPQWVYDYVKWHNEALSQITPENWNKMPHNKYLILRCLQKDPLCAGTADRLANLPTLLRLGYDSKRIVFIHWQVPAPLHEFLIPTSIQWDIPDWLLPKMDLDHLPKSNVIVLGRGGPEAIVNSSEPVLTVIKLLDAEYYDLQRQNVNKEYSSYWITRDVWKLFFAPSPPVAKLVQEELDKDNLQPGKYVATHIRALYHKDKTNDIEFKQAVVCAAQIRADNTDFPVLVASDSNTVTHKALNFGTQHGMRMVSRSTVHNRTVATRHENGTVTHQHHAHKEPLHLDRGRVFLKRQTQDVHKHDVTDFYDIFVDLYLLANAACVTYGTGRFGRLGAQLSYNMSCATGRRIGVRKRINCQWPKKIDQTQNNNQGQAQQQQQSQLQQIAATNPNETTTARTARKVVFLE